MKGLGGAAEEGKPQYRTQVPAPMMASYGTLFSHHCDKVYSGNSRKLILTVWVWSEWQKHEAAGHMTSVWKQRPMNACTQLACSVLFSLGTPSQGTVLSILRVGLPISISSGHSRGLSPR